ncbi:MAG: glycosyltransferase [Deltaproteobacteria bacterium]|nr:glycosyltransferase [Deltaproteobacteria bacterium]
MNSEPLRSMLREDPRALLKRVRALKMRPLMSIVMPVYNTEAGVLRKSIDSVLGQIYKRWELCICDDGSTMTDIPDILKGYAKRESRIKVQTSGRNHGIAKAINKGVGMASGEYLGVLDHDDELDPMTLWEYAGKINEKPDADCIYCDEDKIDENGNYCEPWFKSDWNPDMSLSFNYVMHFAVYRRRLFERLGGVRSAYEGSQDYDILLRVAERTDKIYHIPRVLYHWRKSTDSIASGPEAKPEIFERGLAALQDALNRRGIEGTAEHAPDAWKGVFRVRRKLNLPLTCSVVIASSGDNAGLLRLLDSIKSTGIISSIHEILVCIHSSSGMETDEFSGPYGDCVRFIRFGGKDTVPRAFNSGIEHALGDVIWLMDESMEILSSQSYYELSAQAQREDVGAVGGKIFYPNGFIEHAGVILGPFGILGYAHRMTPDTPGYVGLKNMICNYSAVLGLGMMTRRMVFINSCGFNEEFEKAYWDVDYCLRLRQDGYLVTYTPYAKFRHYISVPSLDEMIIEPEAELFRKKWKHVIERDPYYNPNLTRDLEDFSFSPIS